MGGEGTGSHACFYPTLACLYDRHAHNVKKHRDFRDTAAVNEFYSLYTCTEGRLPLAVQYKV